MWRCGSPGLEWHFGHFSLLGIWDVAEKTKRLRKWIREEAAGTQPCTPPPAPARRAAVRPGLLRLALSGSPERRDRLPALCTKAPWGGFSCPFFFPASESPPVRVNNVAIFTDRTCDSFIILSDWSRRLVTGQRRGQGTLASNPSTEDPRAPSVPSAQSRNKPSVLPGVVQTPKENSSFHLASQDTERK